MSRVSRVCRIGTLQSIAGSGSERAAAQNGQRLGTDSSPDRRQQPIVTRPARNATSQPGCTSGHIGAYFMTHTKVISLESSREGEFDGLYGRTQ